MQFNLYYIRSTSCFKDVLSYVMIVHCCRKNGQKISTLHQFVMAGQSANSGVYIVTYSPKRTISSNSESYFVIFGLEYGWGLILL